MKRLDREVHNEYQQRYYSGALKKSMIPTGTPYLRRQVDELCRFAKIDPRHRVLEVGCGMGRYTLLLAEQGIQIEGQDLTPMQLERQRKFNDGRFEIPLHCGDVADPSKELEGAFDVVIGFFMLHHLHELELCFRGMARMLRPGGRIAFLEPNPFNPLYYLQVGLTPGMTWQAERGMLQMRRSPLEAALLGAGFHRLRIERFGFFPPALANHPLGAKFENLLERVPVWKGMLPFQLIGAELE